MNEILARSAENLTSLAQVNELYRAIGRHISDVLFHSDADRDNFDERYYVNIRRQDDRDGPDNIDIDSLPDDIKQAWSEGRIGIAEVALVDFLLGSNSPHLATLIGKVGTGKSTFLRNVAYHLSTKLTTLNQFCFVYLDLLKISDFSANERDVFDLIITETQALLQRRPAQDPEQIDRKHDLHRFSSMLYARSDSIRISDITRYLLRFKGVFKNTIVLLFDNIDQLRPEFAAEVVAIGRSIYFGTHQPVIIAVRPATDTIRLVAAHGNSSYIPRSLHLSPPDISKVLEKRIDILLKDNPGLFDEKEVVVDFHGFSIKFKDIKKRLVALFNNLLRRSLQHDLYVGLCNYSLRRLFLLIDNILKYRELSYNILFQINDKSQTPYALGLRDRRFFGHLLEAGMVGDRHYYTDLVDAQVIANLYYLQTPNNWSYHALAYHLLIFYEAMRAHVRTNTVLAECAAIGYPAAVVERVLDRLVFKGLIEGADAHGGDRIPTHAKISDCGRFYLKRLVDDNDYLLMVISDVDLSDEWSASTSSVGGLRYIDRVKWIAKLAVEVATEELRVYRRIGDIGGTGKIVGNALLEARPLTVRLRATIRSLCEPRKGIRFGNLNSFNAELDAIELASRSSIDGSLLELQNIINEHREDFISDGATGYKLKLFEVNGLGIVRLSYPEQLAANKAHFVQLSLKPHFNTAANQLMALWMTDEPMIRHSKYFFLRRSSVATPFKGEFKLDPQPTNMPFPTRSDITLFDSATEVAAFNLVA
jgi:hypothetical protein